MRNEVVVAFDRVSKSFGTLRILDEVSFEVARGEALCILGRSGTGKSVSLRLMIGLLRPDKGEVRVFGENIHRLDSAGLARVRKQMGFLFQYSALFDSLTVGDNVAFPLRWHTKLGETEIRRRALDLLEQVGLASSYDKLPTELSGGMRKRVGLVRALALDPEILLVDEPSSGLDPITAAEIDDLLLHLKRSRGTTMIVVTHNIPSARKIGDVLALLDNGSILERGTPDQLLESPRELVQQFMSATGGT